LEVRLEEEDTRDLRVVVVLGELLRLLLCVVVMLLELFRDGYDLIDDRRSRLFVSREDEFAVRLFVSWDGDFAGVRSEDVVLTLFCPELKPLFPTELGRVARRDVPEEYPFETGRMLDRERAFVAAEPLTLTRPEVARTFGCLDDSETLPSRDMEDRSNATRDTRRALS
jgi:hypothetical protein